MMLNRQFEPPTFVELNYDLKAFHSLLYKFTVDFLETSKKEPFVQLANINQDIRKSIQSLSSLETNLRKRIDFYDVKSDTETIFIQTLQEMMRLPPSCERVLSSTMVKRKSSYTPRLKHRGPYRSYTIQEKNHVVHLNLSGMTFAAISKMLEIPQKNVVRWCKEGFIGRDSSRRIADAHMEEALSVWLRSARKGGLLKQTDIQQKARELSTNPQFKASRGWLKNYLRRFSNEIKLENCENEEKKQ